MFDRLMLKLQKFTEKLDMGNKCTQEILDAVNNERWEAVEFATDNRERLLSAIAQEQEGIESVINNVISEELTPENINIIKSWAFDTQNWINHTASMDDTIVEKLNGSKDQVTQEIASLFKAKAAFRGYNLSDVRK